MESFKPSEIIELDFKLYHNAISTQEQLFKVGKTKSSYCQIFSIPNKDIIHLFITCICHELHELHEFINTFVAHHLETLLKDIHVDVNNEMFFSSLTKSIF